MAVPMICGAPQVRSGVRAAHHRSRNNARVVTAHAVLDDDFFSDFFSSSSALERDMWGSMSRQMQAMEKETSDMLSSGSRMLQEAERTSQLQGMKPGTPGSGFSYYSEQHGSHFHSWSSVTVWSNTTTSIAPTVDSGPSWFVMLGWAVLGVYLAICAAFWARYSATRFSVAKRWQLVVLWPFLLALNSKFRAEFLSLLRGAPPTDIPPSNAENARLQSEEGSRS